MKPVIENKMKTKKFKKPVFLKKSIWKILRPERVVVSSSLRFLNEKKKIRLFYSFFFSFRFVRIFYFLRTLTRTELQYMHSIASKKWFLKEINDR